MSKHTKPPFKTGSSVTLPDGASGRIIYYSDYQRNELDEIYPAKVNVLINDTLHEIPISEVKPIVQEKAETVSPWKQLQLV
jgi:hypothetical protein